MRTRRALVVACAALAFVGASTKDAHAKPESPNVSTEVENFLPMDSPEAIHVRKEQLTAYLTQRAANADANFHIKNTGVFCGPFDFYDAASLPRPTWLMLSEMPRAKTVETLSRLVLDCGKEQNGAFRAAWALDFLYFNRLADTTGYSVADVLAFRNALNEYYVASVLEEELGISTAVQHGVHVEHAPDFLDAKPMSKTDLLRRLGGAASAFSPQEQPVLNDFISLLDLRQDYLAPFGHETLKMIRSPEDLRVLAEFYKYEQHLRIHPELLKERHGGWHRLMAIVHGDAPRAIRTLGLLASVHLIVFRDLVPALARRGMLTPEVARAFYEASLSYFLVNEFDERSALNGRDDHSLTYHFFFPDNYETDNWKWYHWYNNAYSACELRRKGYPKPAIVGAIGTVAFLYEGTELNMAMPWRETMKLDPRANPIVEGFADVRINQEGAAYGADVCH
jgi:hypothetical protein